MLMASEKPGFSDRRCVRGPLSGGVRAGGTCLSAAVPQTAGRHLSLPQPWRRRFCLQLGPSPPLPN